MYGDLFYFGLIFTFFWAQASGSVSGCLVCINATSLEDCLNENIFKECEKGVCETNYFIDVKAGDILVSRSCKSQCNTNKRGGVVLNHAECLQSATTNEHCYDCTATVQRRPGCIECDGAASFGDCDSRGRFKECSSPKAKCQSQISVNPENGQTSVTRKCASTCNKSTMAWQDCISSAGETSTCTLCEDFKYYDSTVTRDGHKKNHEKSPSSLDHQLKFLSNNKRKGKSHFSETTRTRGCLQCVNASSIEACDRSATFAVCTGPHEQCVTDHYVNTDTGDFFISRTCQPRCSASSIDIEAWMATADGSDHHYACAEPIAAYAGCVECNNESSPQSCTENGIFRSCNSHKAHCRLDIVTSDEDGDIRVSRTCSDACKEGPGVWQDCIATAQGMETCSYCQKMTYDTSAKYLPLDEDRAHQTVPVKKTHRLKRSVQMTKEQESTGETEIKQKTQKAAESQKNIEDDVLFSSEEIFGGCFVCSNASSVEKCEAESVFTRCVNPNAVCARIHDLNPQTGELRVSQSCEDHCVETEQSVSEWLAFTEAPRRHYACAQTIPGHAGCVVCKNEMSPQRCDERGRFEVCDSASTFCKLDVTTHNNVGEVSVTRTCASTCKATPGDWRQFIATAEGDAKGTTCESLSPKPLSEATKWNAREVTRFRRGSPGIPNNGDDNGDDNGSGDDGIPAEFTCSVETPSLTLDEGTTQNVQVRVANSPSLVCTPAYTTCSVTLKYSMNTNNWPVCNGAVLEQMYFDSACSSPVTTSTFNSLFTVAARGAIDNIVDNDHTSAVTASMVIQRDSTTNVVQCQGQTQVVIKDKDTFGDVCKLSGHFLERTFDDGLYSAALSPDELGPYAVRYHGAYRLYKHATLPFEIQGMFGSCQPSLPDEDSCLCAINVRVYSTVIVLDNCILINSATSGNNQDVVTLTDSVLRVFAYHNDASGFPDGLQVQQQANSNYYKVTLPLGTTVSFQPTGDSTGSSVSVVIKPSLHDLGQAEGMCGNYDSNPNNDFITHGTVEGFVQAQELFGTDNFFPVETIISTSGNQVNTGLPTVCSCGSSQSCSNLPTVTACNVEDILAPQKTLTLDQRGAELQMESLKHECDEDDIPLAFWKHGTLPDDSAAYSPHMLPQVRESPLPHVHPDDSATVLPPTMPDATQTSLP